MLNKLLLLLYYIEISMHTISGLYIKYMYKCIMYINVVAFLYALSHKYSDQKCNIRFLFIICCLSVV